jgi:hypothetical protein
MSIDDHICKMKCAHFNSMFVKFYKFSVPLLQPSHFNKLRGPTCQPPVRIPDEAEGRREGPSTNEHEHGVEPWPTQHCKLVSTNHQTSPDGFPSKKLAQHRPPSPSRANHAGESSGSGSGSGGGIEVGLV